MTSSRSPSKAAQKSCSSFDSDILIPNIANEIPKVLFLRVVPTETQRNGEDGTQEREEKEIVLCWSERRKKKKKERRKEGRKKEERKEKKERKKKKKRKKKMSTTSGIPGWSPSPVLTRPSAA